MSKKTFIVIVALLALCGAGVATELTLLHAKQILQPGFRSFCSWSDTFNCDVVAQSRWAELLGIPIASLGLLYYLFIALLSALAFRKTAALQGIASLIFILTGASLLYSVFLAYISSAVIQTICILCSGLHAVNAAMFAVSWVYLRSPISEVRTAVRLGKESLLQRPMRGMALLSSLVPFLASAWGFGLWTQSLKVKSSALLGEKSVIALGPEEIKLLYGESTPSGSPLIVFEFSDFQCFYCAELSRSLHEAIRPMGDRIKVVFKNYPLDTSCNGFLQFQVHPFACSSAAAAQCAARQGKFWPFHDLLFKNQNAQGPDSLMLYAIQVGLDIDVFKSCLRDPAVLELVRADIALGRRLGIQGVPVFIIKDKMYVGARSAEELRSLIQHNLP